MIIKTKINIEKGFGLTHLSVNSEVGKYFLNSIDKRFLKKETS